MKKILILILVLQLSIMTILAFHILTDSNKVNYILFNEEKDNIENVPNKFINPQRDI